MKNTRLNKYVYDFSVDYNAIKTDNMLDMLDNARQIFNGKEQYKMMLGFIRKCFSIAITFFSCIVLNVNSLEFVSLNNQK